jgi:hypothetical protein
MYGRPAKPPMEVALLHPPMPEVARSSPLAICAVRPVVDETAAAIATPLKAIAPMVNMVTRMLRLRTARMGNLSFFPGLGTPVLQRV